MTPLERLRLAAALGHTVPGTELFLHTDTGERVVVSTHPAGDISPCAFRRVIAASACPNQPDVAQRVAGVTIGGALFDLGGGVFSARCVGVEQRWVASLLDANRVSKLLDAVGLDSVPDDALHARLKPDSGLGVTVLAIGVSDARFHHALDEIAAQVAATCFVEELRLSAASVRHSNKPMGGVS
ncbi:MAG: hypothetical protein AB8G14_08950 [Ilumatobacter sp.]